MSLDDILLPRGSCSHLPQEMDLQNPYLWIAKALSVLAIHGVALEGLYSHLSSVDRQGKIYSTGLPLPVASATRTNVECIPTFVVDRSGPLFDGPGQLSDQRSFDPTLYGRGCTKHPLPLYSSSRSAGH